MPSERILIAEDSPTQAEGLRLILESEGYEAVVVGDGRKALERATEGDWDLLLADVTMPELDGFSLCRALRERDDTSELPVIMLSALDDPSALAQGLEAGVDGWLRKPVEIDELLRGMRAVLDRRARRLEREAELLRLADQIERSLEGTGRDAPALVRELKTRLLGD